MIKLNTDIDQLLDATIDMADEDFSSLIKYIEIDTLLKITEDW